jgi:hypothetical protein
VLYVDAALPGQLRLEWGRLEVQMCESAEALESGLPLLGKVRVRVRVRGRGRGRGRGRAASARQGARTLSPIFA